MEFLDDFGMQQSTFATFVKTISMNLFDLKDIPIESWYFEKVVNPADIENYQFYNRDSPIYCAEDVDVELIKGTTHSNYYNRSWIEMLRNLERHSKVKDIEYIKSVIIDPKIKDRGLVKLGKYYYINGGNHRYCHAKFLQMGKIPSEVTEHLFETETYLLFKELENLGFIPKVKLSQKEWEIDGKNLRLFISSNENVKQFLEYYNSLHFTKWQKVKAVLFGKVPKYCNVRYPFENGDLKKFLCHKLANTSLFT